MLFCIVLSIRKIFIASLFYIRLDLVTVRLLSAFAIYWVTALMAGRILSEIEVYSEIHVKWCCTYLSPVVTRENTVPFLTKKYTLLLRWHLTWLNISTRLNISVISQARCLQDMKNNICVIFVDFNSSCFWI